VKRIWTCRRTFVAIFAISCLTLLGFYGGLEVAGAIATVALAVAASNAAEKSFSKPVEGEVAPRS
jgi:hypothetical protein